MARKRAYGKGSITKFAHDRYRARIYIAGKRYSKYHRTKAEADAWIEDIKAPFEQGLSYDAMHVSLSVYLKNWLINKKAEIKPKTHYQYTQLINDHIIPKIGSMMISDLRPGHIQALYNRMLEQNAGIRTIRLIHSVLHNAFSQAVKDEMMIRNITEATSPPRPRKKKIQVLSEEESDRLRDAIQGNKLEALFYLAMLTGLRKGELLGLKWLDLDWNTGQINIRRQVQRVHGQSNLLTTLKTERSARTITISHKMLEKLYDHKKAQQLQRIKLGKRWIDNDLIFPSSVGTPLEPSNFDRIWRGVRDRADLKCRFHDLRHLAASMMLVKLRIAPTEVAAVLGHTQTSTTLDIYGHLLPSIGSQTAHEMEELIMPIKVENWPKIGTKLAQNGTTEDE
jgi:integrase